MAQDNDMVQAWLSSMNLTEKDIENFGKTIDRMISEKNHCEENN